MSRENFLILLGILVVLSPFAGLPLAWLMWLLPILGALIVIIGIMIRRSRRTQENPVAQ
ncbi:MAG: hypothetical protein P4M11_07280 [Candidatus Pacebacteria bacterium]|nr:hypothetical protein [Candidatus Paceibacterota bacterium]